MHAFLQQRLAAGDFHQVAIVVVELRDDLGNRQLAPFVEMRTRYRSNCSAGCIRSGARMRTDGPHRSIRPGC